MWKRRVKVCGLFGAKMLSKAIRQYNRASALSQRRSSLKGVERIFVKKKKVNPPLCSICIFFKKDTPTVFPKMVTNVEQILNSW